MSDNQSSKEDRAKRFSTEREGIQMLGKVVKSEGQMPLMPDGSINPDILDVDYPEDEAVPEAPPPVAGGKK